MITEIQLSDIQAAAERIRPIAHRTPVLTSRSFNDVAGTNVFFKCENFQRGGAFKIPTLSTRFLKINLAAEWSAILPEITRRRWRSQRLQSGSRQP